MERNLKNGQEVTKKMQNNINDFCITFSTINGSGSATANTTVLRAIFKMGIPISGKNIFPSNIQGLPTWYTLRVSKDGYLARLDRDDIVVAMNPTTILNEQEYIVPGGVLIYPDDFMLPDIRQDITIYKMPVKKIITDQGVPLKLRNYLTNMVYVGVLAKMINIDLEKIHDALKFHFKGKEEAVELNFSMVTAAAEWAGKSLLKEDDYYLEPMALTDHCIMADGNTAAALGSIYGGVQFTAWYPITPASSLPEALNEYLPLLRKDTIEKEKNTYVVIQAEDELSAIGMAVGAGWAGLRAMTSTSGPGFSLMTEYIGLAYYTETPVVIWNVQRAGPSTGLPTRTAQGDLTQAYFLSHGDTQYIILIPGNINECFDFGWQAFDYAEHYQTPVIVLSDLDLGMNQWMAKEFEYPAKSMDRGKIVWENGLDDLIMRSNGKWGRYLDIDNDGIPYRTLPGNKHHESGYFSRGTGHDEYGNYTEDPFAWKNKLDRLHRKIGDTREKLPQPVTSGEYISRVGIISMGSTDCAIQECRDKSTHKGTTTDYLRVRAIPFSKVVEHFIQNHDRVYVIEINHDGQLRQLLSTEYPAMAGKLISISKTDGLPLTAGWILNMLESYEGKYER